MYVYVAYVYVSALIAQRLLLRYKIHQNALHNFLRCPLPIIFRSVFPNDIENLHYTILN